MKIDMIKMFCVRVIGLLYSAFVLLLMCACHGAKRGDVITNDHSITEVFQLSNDDANLTLVDSVTYIPLMEDNDYLFSSISKIIVKKDKVYVFDLLGSNSLFCFDITGHFLFKIGQKGEGPQEYLKLWDFDVNDHYVYLYDISRKKMLKYDLQGDFITSRNTTFRASAFKLLDNGEVLFSFEKGEEDNILLVQTDSCFVVQKKILKYADKNCDDKITNNLFQVSGDYVFYNKPVNDTVYLFSKEDGGLVKKYIFDFEKRSVSPNLKNNYEKLVDDRVANDYVYFFDTPFVVGNRLIGSVFKGKNKGTLIYDLKTKKYHINKWIPNELSYRDITIPLFTNGRQIVSWMDDEIFECLKVKPLLTPENLRHLKEGGRLLVIYNTIDRI